MDPLEPSSRVGGTSTPGLRSAHWLCFPVSFAPKWCQALMCWGKLHGANMGFLLTVHSEPLESAFQMRARKMDSSGWVLSFLWLMLNKVWWPEPGLCHYLDCDGDWKTSFPLGFHLWMCMMATTHSFWTSVWRDAAIPMKKAWEQVAPWPWKSQCLFTSQWIRGQSKGSSACFLFWLWLWVGASDILSRSSLLISSSGGNS